MQSVFDRQRKGRWRFGNRRKCDDKICLHRKLTRVARAMGLASGLLVSRHRLFPREQPTLVFMPELPWEKWYPTNWASEPGLRLCDAATRGVWIEAVNSMMLSQTYKVSGTLEQLAGLCICKLVEMRAAVDQLKRFKVAEVSEQNRNIILVNRKRARDCGIRELRRKAGLASGTKRRTSSQQHVGTNDPTPSASVYAYASVSTSKPLIVNGDSFYPELVRRLSVVFNRKAGDTLSYMEESSIFQISKRPNIKTEIGEVERFRMAEQQYFAQKMMTVLNDWQGTLDRARNRPLSPDQLKRKRELESEQL